MYGIKLNEGATDSSQKLNTEIYYIYNMLKFVFLIGLVIFIVGLITLLGLSVPYATGYINKALSFLPLQAHYIAIILSVLGIILMVLGGKISKMGKYYKFY